jgi:hypothetical protein
MEKIRLFLDKWSSTILIVLCPLIFFNTCGTKSQNERNGRRIDGLQKVVSSLDSTLSTKVSEQEMEIMLEIMTLETARRVVYDQNTIVRTTKRPDDVMNEYDAKIKELRKKLNALNK